MRRDLMSGDHGAVGGGRVSTNALGRSSHLADSQPTPPVPYRRILRCCLPCGNGASSATAASTRGVKQSDDGDIIDAGGVGTTCTKFGSAAAAAVVGSIVGTTTTHRSREQPQRQSRAHLIGEADFSEAM